MNDISEDTMTGDLRDMILTHIRAMETPWSKLSEREQQSKIDAATRAAESMVRNAVSMVAKRGFPSLHVVTGKFTVKDGIKLEVTATGSVENITALAEHGTDSAVLVLAEASAYFGAKAAAKADPDEPDMLGDEGELEDEAA